MSFNCAVTHLSPALSWSVLAFNCRCQKIASCQKRQGTALLLEHSLYKIDPERCAEEAVGDWHNILKVFVLIQCVVIFWMLNHVNSKGEWNRASSVMEQDCRRQHSYSAVPHKTELEPKEGKVEQLPRHSNIMGDWSPNSHSVSLNGHCARCAGSLYHGLREKGSVSKSDSSWHGTKVGQMICLLEESQLLHHFWRDASHAFKPAEMSCLMSKIASPTWERPRKPWLLVNLTLENHLKWI